MSQTTASRPALRVALADDAALFRQGLALLLAEAGFTVTARVGDAQALLAAVHTDPPDAVVVDIRMPPTHTTEGLDAARALARDPPGSGSSCSPRTSSRDTPSTCSSPAPRGAGYLLKERVADVDELGDAVRRVAAGGLVVDPSVVAALVGRRRARNPLDDLTEREREVLAVMAEGRSNQAICRAAVPEPEDGGVLRAVGVHQARAHRGPRRQPAGAGRARLPAELTGPATGTRANRSPSARSCGRTAVSAVTVCARFPPPSWQSRMSPADA